MWQTLMPKHMAWVKKIIEHDTYTHAYVYVSTAIYQLTLQIYVDSLTNPLTGVICPWAKVLALVHQTVDSIAKS